MRDLYLRRTFDPDVGSERRSNVRGPCPAQPGRLPRTFRMRCVCSSGCARVLGGGVSTQENAGSSQEKREGRMGHQECLLHGWSWSITANRFLDGQHDGPNIRGR